MPESRMSPDSSCQLSFEVVLINSFARTAAYTLSSSPFSAAAPSARGAKVMKACQGSA